MTQKWDLTGGRRESREPERIHRRQRSKQRGKGRIFDRKIWGGKIGGMAKRCCGKKMGKGKMGRRKDRIK
jgi:hypothetical protein